MTLGRWFDVATFAFCWLAVYAAGELIVRAIARTGWWHRRVCAMCRRAHESRRREVVLWR